MTGRLRADRGFRDRADDAAGAGQRGAQARLDHRRPDGDQAGRRDRLRLRQVRLHPSPGHGAAGADLRQVHPALPRRPPVGHRRGARRGSADQLLPARRVGRRRRVPLAHCRSTADHRATRPAVAALGSGDDVRAVGAGLQLDGPGGPVATGCSSPPRAC